MSVRDKLAGGDDKPLFTPGPLTTSRSVKQAMLRDLGSRDTEFIETVRQIREDLLALADAGDSHEAVLMQGSGTFAIESVISSAIPPDGALLVLINGSYGERIAQIAERHGISVVRKTCAENALHDVSEVDAALSQHPGVSMVAVVHCETTSGIMNRIDEIGQVVRRHGKTYFVDSMSAFGGVVFDFQACNIDYLVSSANKCIEGVPGFGFAICRRSALESTEGWARTVSLDLLAQWRGLERNGQFRFTPPTHTLLAFAQALDELRQEGGVAARAARYRENHQVLVAGMQKLGFEEYVPRQLQGHIITSFRFPTDPRFEFDVFYRLLSDRGFVIYPGKVSDADCFRIGNIGRLFPHHLRTLLLAIAEVLREMEIVDASAAS